MFINGWWLGVLWMFIHFGWCLCHGKSQFHGWWLGLARHDGLRKPPNWMAGFSVWCKRLVQNHGHTSSLHPKFSDRYPGIRQSMPKTSRSSFHQIILVDFTTPHPAPCNPLTSLRSAARTSHWPIDPLASQLETPTAARTRSAHQSFWAKTPAYYVMKGIL